MVGVATCVGFLDHSSKESDAVTSCVMTMLVSFVPKRAQPACRKLGRNSVMSPFVVVDACSGVESEGMSVNLVNVPVKGPSSPD